MWEPSCVFRGWLNHSSDTKSSTVKLCHCDAVNWTVQRTWACSYWNSSSHISWITSVRMNRPDSGFINAAEYLKYSFWVLITVSLTQRIQLLQILSVRNEASGSSVGLPQVRQMLFPWLRTPLPSGTPCSAAPIWFCSQTLMLSAPNPCHTRQSGCSLQRCGIKATRLGVLLHACPHNIYWPIFALGIKQLCMLCSQIWASIVELARTLF